MPPDYKITKNITDRVDAAFSEVDEAFAMPHTPSDIYIGNQKAVQSIIELLGLGEDRIAYLRPNRDFRLYQFKAKNTDVTCWLPEGFMI